MTRKINTRDEEQDSKASQVRNRRGSRRMDGPSDSETTSSETTQSTCPECDGTIIQDTTQGEEVCDDCGLVVDDTHVDRGPEWRAFDSKERNSKSRVGSPTTKMLHDKGLSTNISWQDKDAYGNNISSTQRQKMKRLRKWNERFRTRDSQDRGLKAALSEVSRMSSALGLTKNTGGPTREVAAMIYRRCIEDDLITGRSIEGMATAALYAACRINDIPRSLGEMARVSRVEQKRIARAYSYINKELGLEIGPSDPTSYVNRFVSDLDIQDEDRQKQVKRLSRHFIEKMKENGMTVGRAPQGVAAGCIHASNQLWGVEVSQEQLSDVCETTEVTLRQRYQELIDGGSEDWIHNKV